MIDINSVARQVIRNCQVSDAHHAGLYSICGLALRLRDLYKWEMALPPWVEKDSSEILEWIGEKEDTWEQLADEDFTKIVINGKTFDLFDAEGINTLLMPQGIFYGAGYVHSMKPTFYLAQIHETIHVKGHSVYILGRELARDLITVPALSQDRSVVIRKESGKLFVWNQIMFLKKSGRQALQFALKRLGLTDQSPEALGRHLDGIFSVEMQRYIYHELGEVEDRDFNRDIWREMISAFSHTPIEFLLRAVKDVLADTNENGPLKHIIKTKNEASLGFYVAFLDGLVRELLPEIRAVFSTFIKTKDWGLIEQAVSEGYSRSKDHANSLCSIFNEGNRNNDFEGVKTEIEKRFLIPLGVVPKKETSP